MTAPATPPTTPPTTLDVLTDEPELCDCEPFVDDVCPPLPLSEVEVDPPAPAPTPAVPEVPAEAEEEMVVEMKVDWEELEFTSEENTLLDEVDPLDKFEFELDDTGVEVDDEADGEGDEIGVETEDEGEGEGIADEDEEMWEKKWSDTVRRGLSWAEVGVTDEGEE